LCALTWPADEYRAKAAQQTKQQGCKFRKVRKVRPAEEFFVCTEVIRGRWEPSALSRAAGFGTGCRGKLFERSEFLPRRLQTPATGVVSAARLPFLLFLFFGQAKKRMPLPQGDRVWGLLQAVGKKKQVGILVIGGQTIWRLLTPQGSLFTIHKQFNGLHL